MRKVKGSDMMDKPLVSVIMPVYNAERYIRAAVDSILRQSFSEFELIVVDDCGADSSMEILAGIKDERIKIIHNGTNQGIAFSRNRAIGASVGKYIAIMDDDDIAMPDRLLHQVQFLESNPMIDVLGGQASIIDENGNVLCKPEIMQENCKMNKVMFLFYNSFHNSEVMVRRSFIEKYNIRYCDNMLGMEDFRFWIDCSAYGKISNINEEVLQYRLTKTNETTRVKESRKNDRKELYLALRQYSLEKNGFYLDRKELEVLNDVINEEGNGTFHSAMEVIELFQTMYKIVEQAKRMQVDYQDELQMWLKIIFNNKISGTSHIDIFS